MTTSLFQRRRTRIRYKLNQLRTDRPRITVNRTNKHIYAQIVEDGKVIVAVNTTQKSFEDLKNGGTKAAAERVGTELAKAAKSKKVSKVVFDRSGYLYHGRVKSLADAARAAGLEF